MEARDWKSLYNFSSVSVGLDGKSRLGRFLRKLQRRRGKNKTTIPPMIAPTIAAPSNAPCRGGKITGETGVCVTTADVISDVIVTVISDSDGEPLGLVGVELEVGKENEGAGVVLWVNRARGIPVEPVKIVAVVVVEVWITVTG